MPHVVSIQGEDQIIRIVERHRDWVILSVNDRLRKVELFTEPDGDVFGADIDGRPFQFTTARDGEDVYLNGHGFSFRAVIQDPIAAAQDRGSAADEIRAPMPGSVVEVRAAAGDAVKRGDVVLVIESMKLQTNLTAPRDGVLAELLVGTGDTFGKDAAVAHLQPLEEE